MLFMSFDCQAFASVHCCLVVTCWERADLFALVGMFIVVLLLSHVVSWVMCGTLSLPSFLLLLSKLSHLKCHLCNKIIKKKKSPLALLAQISQ